MSARCPITRLTARESGSVIDLYQRHGAAWAALRNRALVEAGWLDRFCALLPADGAILDIGCGSGLGAVLIRGHMFIARTRRTPHSSSGFVVPSPRRSCITATARSRRLGSLSFSAASSAAAISS